GGPACSQAMRGIFAYALPRMRDIHSFARPDEARVKHLILDLTTDFDRKQLSGSATLQLETATSARELVLDTNGLTIDRVTSESGKELKFALGAPVKYLGRSLTIPIDAS